jgi:hypothetical protein
VKTIIWNALSLGGTLLVCGMLSIAHAQVNKEDLKTGSKVSPEAETSVIVNGKTIWVFYHAPSVKGRKMFGGTDALQPDDTIWRLGADYATVLHTDADLDFGGLAVPKGDYVLYADLDKGKWTLILNKKLMAGTRHIWGINRDGSTTNDKATELGRAAMTMAKPSSPVETLKITLSNAGTKGKLLVEFENVTASVLFTVK